MFLMFSDHFDVLISKIIFKNIKKHYFNVFWNEKYFKKQLLPHFQVPCNHVTKAAR
jgi:hypothetical protein